MVQTCPEEGQAGDLTLTWRVRSGQEVEDGVREEDEKESR